MISQVSDVVWQALIAAVLTIALTWMQQRTKQSVENSTKEAKESAEAAEVKLDDLVKYADATHTLVNSNMGVQLRLVAELSRWKAEQTGRPEDTEAADMADRMLSEHNAKQSIVDDKAG